MRLFPSELPYHGQKARHDKAGPTQESAPDKNNEGTRPDAEKQAPPFALRIGCINAIYRAQFHIGQRNLETMGAPPLRRPA